MLQHNPSNLTGPKAIQTTIKSLIVKLRKRKYEILKDKKGEEIKKKGSGIEKKKENKELNCSYEH